GVNFEFPSSRVLLAGVVARDALEVFQQIEAQWGVDVNPRRDAGERLFLHEGRMKMTGVERHQANFRHSFAFCFLLCGRMKNESCCYCRTQHDETWVSDSAKLGFHSISGRSDIV